MVSARTRLIGVTVMTCVGLAAPSSAWAQDAPKAGAGRAGVERASGQDEWATQGSRRIATSTGAASIDLSGSSISGRAVRLVAKDGPLHITRIDVIYADGTRLTDTRSHRLQQGQSTFVVGQRVQPGRIVRVDFAFEVTNELRAAGAQRTVEVVTLGGQAAVAAKRAPAARSVSQEQEAARRPSEPSGGSGPPGSGGQGAPPPMPLPKMARPAPSAASPPPPPPPPAPSAPASAPPPSDAASAPRSVARPPVVATMPPPPPIGSPAPSSAPPPSAPRSMNPTAANVCVTQNICTPVRVFFGTDRRRADVATRVSFGAERAGQLQLGQSIVTVPKVADRKRGEIRRPTWFERTVLRVPADGDPAKHFTILKDGFTIYRSADAFLDDVRAHMREAGDFKDHAFVFVHGYNTTFDAALYRTAQIAYDLGEDGVPFGTAFLYTWPSGGELKDYKYDSESARFTVENLITFLDIVIAKSEAKHVHLIAHSMGNDPMLNALDRFVAPPSARGRVNQVVLAAPDVDAREFEKIAQRIVPKAKGVTLFASANDRAMFASRQVHKNNPRAGDVPTSGPVVVAGLDSIDVSTISTDVLGVNHDTYANSRELINEVALLFRKGERPPHARTPTLVRLPPEQPKWWKFP